ncbi:hypothetical protein EVAR_53190_1 [Eumeta japonica]|uniref:Uncharacterized protein n=1 Tax=Eumeta variegata TaxID=151549 RepID=A0A4C1YXS4_EUMVA|nr:hypothetical protein EVAR_53190_1 [Eumeta japonica]
MLTSLPFITLNCPMQGEHSAWNTVQKDSSRYAEFRFHPVPPFRQGRDLTFDFAAVGIYAATMAIGPSLSDPGPPLSNPSSGMCAGAAIRRNPRGSRLPVGTYVSQMFSALYLI